MTWRSRLAGPLTIGLLAAACGSTPPADRATAPEADPSTSGDTAAPTSTRPAITDDLLVEFEVDQTFRIALGQPVTIDLATASPASPGEMVLADLLYDTLVVLDDDGVARPGLASFAANAEETIWRFTLRDDATFADGTAITAADVVDSLNRVRAEGVTTLPAVRLERVIDVRAVDDRAVEIEVDAPWSILPEVLSAPSYGIADAEVIAAAKDGERVVVNASGDYEVVSQTEQSLALERRADVEGPESVLVTIASDEGAAFDAFVSGDADWAVIPPDRFEEALTSRGTGGVVPFHGTLFLAVDPDVAPLGTPAVRRAIALAIDRAEVVDEVYGPAAQPLLGLVPAGVAGGSVEECLAPCGPARDEARELLAAALPDGQTRPLRLLTDDTETLSRLGSVVGEQLESVGLDVEVSAEAPDTFEQLVNAGQQQLFIFGWLGVARTPADHLAALFHSTSPDNVSDYEQEATDALIDGAFLEPGAEQRAATWAQVESQVLADVAVVPLVQLRTTSVISDRVEGLVIRPDATLDLHGVTLVAADG